MILTKSEFDRRIASIMDDNDIKINERIQMNNDTWKIRLDNMNNTHIEHIEEINKQNDKKIEEAINSINDKWNLLVSITAIILKSGTNVPTE